MLGAFEFRVDDYVGRRMVVGFVFSSPDTDLPLKISKIFDPDCDVFDTEEFHNRLKSTFGDDSLSIAKMKFGFYRNEVTESDPQHDGTHVAVEMDLKLEMDVEFEVSTLNRFIANGNLNEDDPPVLSLRFFNPRWLDESKQWGWSSGGVGKNKEQPPSEAEILVEMESAPCLSFIYSGKGYLYSPSFSDFEVL